MYFILKGTYKVKGVKFVFYANIKRCYNSIIVNVFELGFITEWRNLP